MHERALVGMRWRLKHLRFSDIVQAADLQMGKMQDSRGIRIIMGVVWEVIGSRGGKRPSQIAEARSCYQDVKEGKKIKRRHQGKKVDKKE